MDTSHEAATQVLLTHLSDWAHVCDGTSQVVSTDDQMTIVGVALPAGVAGADPVRLSVTISPTQ